MTVAELKQKMKREYNILIKKIKIMLDFLF